ncbi:MAG TPA: MerR family transcriptional regulator [Candidatus Kryptobacter bacterium]|nr:MerR family transcriptional regulator [Candidatus Kryptobacter bacterium]
MMKEYTVQHLAKTAGVSVRTLHHYDHIGLLKPSSRNAARYRFYGEAELLRLQQILFFKELDCSLEDIARILDSPGFDPIDALEAHREELKKRAVRLETLLETIDKTIRKLKGDKIEMTDEELYGGLSKEQAEAYAEEARQRWDPKLVDETNARVKKWSKEKWAKVNKEIDEVMRQLAALMGTPVEDRKVQALVARHHAYLNNFYEVKPDMYRSLGKLYIEDPRFRAYFEKYRAGLTDYLAQAIEFYCDKE